MCFRLFRGKRLEEVLEACQAETGSEDSNEDPADSLGSTRWECAMKPKPRAREEELFKKRLFKCPLLRSPNTGMCTT